MLRVPQSFIENELAALVGIFSISDVASAYSKASKWLGVSISWAKPVGSKLVKVYLTSKTSPWRCLFAFFVAKDIWIPILLRTKNDKVGQNLSSDNPHFEKALLRAFDALELDLIERKYSDYQ